MTLSIIWFIVIAVLWTIYMVLEGFDFGVGMLLPAVARSDEERSVAIRTIGPHWDGNEVWLITAGAAMFAAFPEWYATMFSGMYLALFLILVALILRIAAIEWRSKIASAGWRAFWDRIHTGCALVVPLLFGVAFANLVQGMEIEVQNSRTLEVIPASEVTDATLAYSVHNLTGGFLSLLTPFTLVGGVVVVLLCATIGSQFLSLKTDGPVRQRATAIASVSSVVTTVVAAVWVIWGQLAYSPNVFSWIPLLIAAGGLIVSAANSQKAMRDERTAFIGSAVGVVGAVAWIFTSMAPDVMRSSIDPAYSLTISQASSTTPTLIVMSIVTIILLPLVIAYTLWSYWVFRHRVSEESVDTNPGLIVERIRGGANFLNG